VHCAECVAPPRPRIQPPVLPPVHHQSAVEYLVQGCVNTSLFQHAGPVTSMNTWPLPDLQHGAPTDWFTAISTLTPMQYSIVGCNILRITVCASTWLGKSARIPSRRLSHEHTSTTSVLTGAHTPLSVRAGCWRRAMLAAVRTLLSKARTQNSAQGTKLIKLHINQHVHRVHPRASRPASSCDSTACMRTCRCVPWVTPPHQPHHLTR
jgi:hypothetical protein